LGPEHEEVAEANQNLAFIKLEQGKTDEAISLLKNSLSVIEKTFGLDHPKYFVAKNDLINAENMKQKL